MPPLRSRAAALMAGVEGTLTVQAGDYEVLVSQRAIAVHALETPAASDQGVAMLRRLIRRETITNGIIFCNRKTTVRELAKSLKSHGFSAGEIHGDMDQSDRIAEFDRFKKDEINILVASDVANGFVSDEVARGVYGVVLAADGQPCRHRVK